MWKNVAFLTLNQLFLGAIFQAYFMCEKDVYLIRFYFLCVENIDVSIIWLFQIFRLVDFMSDEKVAPWTLLNDYRILSTNGEIIPLE